MKYVLNCVLIEAQLAINVLAISKHTFVPLATSSFLYISVMLCKIPHPTLVFDQCRYNN